MDEKEKNLTPEEENAPENIENEVKAEVADTVEATKNVAEAAECIAAETAENAEAAESIAAETAENAENVSADGEELAIADIVEIDEAASAAKDTKISEKAENDRKTDAESGSPRARPCVHMLRYHSAVDSSERSVDERYFTAEQ